MTEKISQTEGHDDLAKLLSGFALGGEGPLFQRFRPFQPGDAGRLRLRDGIVLALFAWLPLLLLTGWQGQLFRTGVAVPFIADFEVHVRLLVALPLLVVAGLSSQEILQPMLRQFIDRALLGEDGVPQFKAALRSAYQLRSSVLAEVLLLVFVYAAGIPLIWRHFIALEMPTWYATPVAGDVRLTLAGNWFAYVSLPIFQFLLCRWYFRVFIWARLLWAISRIKLNLIPTHPDQMGGLRFVTDAARAFLVLALVHGVLLAGWLSTRTVSLTGLVTDFSGPILAMVIFTLSITFAPMLVFTPQLSQTKVSGLHHYGTLAARYARDFDAKWIRAEVAPGDTLLGSSDIQSLADMRQCYDIVASMRRIPITRINVSACLAAMLIPIAPLALTMMSLEQLARELISVLF